MFIFCQTDLRFRRNENKFKWHYLWSLVDNDYEDYTTMGENEIAHWSTRDGSGNPGPWRALLSTAENSSQHLISITRLSGAAWTHSGPWPLPAGGFLARPKHGREAGGVERDILPGARDWEATNSIMWYQMLQICFTEYSAKCLFAFRSTPPIVYLLYRLHRQLFICLMEYTANC